jgi:hypothetical protein
VIGTLAHELTHAALPYDAAHGPEFAAIQDDIGMVGPPEANIPGPRFVEWAQKSVLPELDKLMQRSTLERASKHYGNESEGHHVAG